MQRKIVQDNGVSSWQKMKNHQKKNNIMQRKSQRGHDPQRERNLLKRYETKLPHQVMKQKNQINRGKRRKKENNLPGMRNLRRKKSMMRILIISYEW